MDRVCGKHSKHNSRKTLLFAASILSSCFLLSQGQDGTLTITVEPPMPRKGASVTLKPGTLPENVLYCRWYRESPADPNLIITGFGKVPGDTKGPAYTERETVDSNCCLQITDLNATDSGTYIMIAGGPGVSLTGSAKFEVIEKFPKPVLLPAKYAALEHENVTLHCDISSSSAFNISWFKGGLALPTKAIISEDKNLTLPDFTKDDAGTYTCAASNHLSTEESNPSIITLAYSSGSGSGGLSGGAIAGIVLGSLAVILALTGTLFCFVFHRGRHQGGKTESPVTPPPSYYENIASFGQVKTGANLESSLGTSHTYVELQYKDQAVYQEIK